MVNVDTDYLRDIVSESNLNLPEMSVVMGYCPEYLGNCIGEGRISKDYLKMLSVMLNFPYKKALVK
jgi:hypothetical protein